MSISLFISLVVFSIAWIIFILHCIRTSKLSVRYSLAWLFAALLILLVGIFPNFIDLIARFFGFLTSDFIIGIILSLLLLLVLLLTIIVTNQKTQIKNLIQEVSTLKMKK